MFKYRQVPLQEPKEPSRKREQPTHPKDWKEKALRGNPWLDEEDLELLKPKPAKRPRGDGGHSGRPRRARKPHEFIDDPDLSPSEVGSAASSSPDELLEHEDEEPIEEPVPKPVKKLADELDVPYLRDMFDYDLAEEDRMFFFTRQLAWGDAAAGYSRPGVASQWAKFFRFPRQFANYFSIYGVYGANELAREYCRRALYYFHLWYDNDDADFTYTQAHVDAYVPGISFVEWMATTAEGSEARARCNVLINMRPSLPEDEHDSDGADDDEE